MDSKGIRSNFSRGIGAALFSVAMPLFAQDVTVVDPKSASIKKVGTLITQLKSSTPGIVDISVHGKTADGKVTTVASTNSASVGQPSTPRDADVVETSSLSIRNDGGVFDIKVPLKSSASQTLGAAGVRLAGDGGLTLPAAKEQAMGIAKKIEQVMADMK